MSPILTLQRQAATAGRIRLGHRTATADGKMRPAKLDHFRFTTPSRHAAESVAALLGGLARPWVDAPRAGEWEVFTERDQLDVLIPPGPRAIDSWLEMWRPKMCVRRCDGVTERLSQQPCPCAGEPERAEKCRPTTRVNVLVPDLPGVGAWLLESHGFYAATELPGIAETLAAYKERGVIVPATLRIEQRERTIYRGEEQRPEVRKYPVPVLDVRASLREIAGAIEAGARMVGALPPPPTPARALTAGPAETERRPPGGDPGHELAQLTRQALVAPTVAVLRRVDEQARKAGLLRRETQVPGDDVVQTLHEVIQQRKAELEAEGQQ